jgi:hypothetical protein
VCSALPGSSPGRFDVPDTVALLALEEHSATRSNRGANMIGIRVAGPAEGIWQSCTRSAIERHGRRADWVAAYVSELSWHVIPLIDVNAVED